MCKINRNTNYAINQLKGKVKLEKNESGILISRDCIITETYTGKIYKYRAYNYITGDTKYIGYKKEGIKEDAYQTLLSKVADFSFYNISYPKGGEELINYIFTTIFKNFGFNIRTDQIELSKHMYEVMAGKSISLSDIAVGLGKTHAYLIASIVYHLDCAKSTSTGKGSNIQPIVISTSSKRLQKAIVKEYVPEISKMLLVHGIIEEEITAVIRKGRNNYICDIRLRNYINALNPNKKNPKEYEMLNNILEGKQVDLEDVTELRNYDRERIKVIQKHCSSCPQNKPCRYRKLLEQVNHTKYFFQVSNHNYMIADILKRSREQKPLLPDYEVVIYDEAHKLPDAYMTMCIVELEKNEMLEIIKEIKPKNKNCRSSKLLIQYGNEFIKEVNLIFMKASLNILQNSYEESNKYPVKNIYEIRQSLYKLRKHILHIILLIPNDKRREQIALEKLGDHVDMLISDEGIIWIEHYTQPQKTVIKGISKKINQMLGQDLINKNNAILLTSGTLAVNGDFNYIKNALGIDKDLLVKEIVKLSPFDYYQNTLLYQADDIPYPNQESDEYITKVADKIAILTIASYGHALVLFTSYEMMRKVYRILKSKHMQYPLFILSRDSSIALNDYQKSRDGILLACGSIWEGVDFAGDLLSHLIIVKLPFSIPDPITDYQKLHINKHERFKKEILIPQMLTKLKQGYGRAIRSETDTAVISILDIRANEKYKEVVRQALPNCRITYNIEDIKTFIQEKKSPEYFFEQNNVSD